MRILQNFQCQQEVSFSSFRHSFPTHVPLSSLLVKLSIMGLLYHVATGQSSSSWPKAGIPNTPGQDTCSDLPAADCNALCIIPRAGEKSQIPLSFLHPLYISSVDLFDPDHFITERITLCVFKLHPITVFQFFQSSKVFSKAVPRNDQTAGSGRPPG